MELALFELAFAAYSVSAALAVGYAYSRDERLSAWMWSVLGGALLLHAGSTGFRLAAFWSHPENQWLLPVNSFFGALSFLTLAMAAVFFVVEGRHRLNILGVFVLPVVWLGAFGTLLRGSTAGTELAVLPPELQSPWMNLHPVVLMTAYAGFANAFGVALALLLQERQMKSKKPIDLCYRLPAISELDDLNFAVVAASFPVLTAGLLMGGLWAHGTWEPAGFADPKVAFALLTWGVYGAYLWMRAVSGIRGRRALYVSMAGFAVALLTFVAADSVSTLHGYLSEGGILR